VSEKKIMAGGSSDFKATKGTVLMLPGVAVDQFEIKIVADDAWETSGETGNDSGQGMLGCSVGSSEPPWAEITLESHGVPSARADSAAQDGEQHAVWRA
jgi:hypothetical protein